MVNKTEKYVPEYAKGEILVKFKGSKSSDFARDFGKGLGIMLSEESYEHGDCFIYKTAVGKERKAITHFSKYPRFVDWASLRDKKIESRWGSLEEAIGMMQDINDNVEISDKAYDKKIDEIIVYLKRLK
jgi:hypothetical protein